MRLRQVHTAVAGLFGAAHASLLADPAWRKQLVPHARKGAAALHTYVEKKLRLQLDPRARRSERQGAFCTLELRM